MTIMTLGKFKYFSSTNVVRLHTSLDDAKETYDKYVEELNWSIFDGESVDKSKIPIYGRIEGSAMYDIVKGEFV